MEQRRLRLGDTLDDYCPRERRVTNHAIVAMVEDDVKQTRCTTCDAEHAYKGGKAPRKRKKETPSALYREVLAGKGDAGAAPAPTAAVVVPVREDAPRPEIAGLEARTEDAPAGGAGSEIAANRTEREAESTPPPANEDEFDAPRAAGEEGPVHRPLIRATLPRPEGLKDERRIPEFTVRHNAGRGNGAYRGGDVRGKQRGGFGSNGNRGHGGPRFAGSRPGGGRGPGRGAQSSTFRSGQPQPRHGGRKRSR